MIFGLLERETTKVTRGSTRQKVWIGGEEKYYRWRSGVVVVVVGVE